MWICVSQETKKINTMKIFCVANSSPIGKTSSLTMRFAVSSLCCHLLKDLGGLSSCCIVKTLEEMAS